MPRFADIDEYYAYVDVDPSKLSDRDITVLARCLGAAEDFVEEYTKRTIAPVPAAGSDPPATKQYRLRGRRWLGIADLRLATSVTLDGATLLPDTGYELDADTDDEAATSIALLGAVPYTRGVTPGVLTITGYWGWQPIPDGMFDAVSRLGSRLYHERDATYSDAVVSADGAVMQYFRQLPASVQAYIDHKRIRMLGFARAR